MKKSIFKCILAVPAILVAVFICRFALPVIDLALPNRGWEFGYYGQFNRVKHVIEDMTHVKIVDHWIHKDITLEDFGFTLLVDGTTEVHIQFYDESPEKEERSKSRLRTIIQARLD